MVAISFYNGDGIGHAYCSMWRRYVTILCKQRHIVGEFGGGHSFALTETDVHNSEVSHTSLDLKAATPHEVVIMGLDFEQA